MIIKTLLKTNLISISFTFRNKMLRFWDKNSYLQ